MRSLLQIALLAVCGMLASCAFNEYPSGKVLPHGGVSSLPTGYTGSAYFWNGSYHTGGRYETGRFLYRDCFYNSRYLYEGTYLYGGNLQYIQGVTEYPGEGYSSSARRAYKKHRYPQPFHHYPYH
ncbi:MAG: hypothetical protein ACKOHM_10230 [Spartobacteria bacterium]